MYSKIVLSLIWNNINEHIHQLTTTQPQTRLNLKKKHNFILIHTISICIPINHSNHQTNNFSKKPTPTPKNLKLTPSTPDRIPPGPPSEGGPHGGAWAPRRPCRLHGNQTTPSALGAPAPPPPSPRPWSGPPRNLSFASSPAYLRGMSYFPKWKSGEHMWVISWKNYRVLCVWRLWVFYYIFLYVGRFDWTVRVLCFFLF